VYDNIDCEIILQLMRAQTFRNSIANLAKINAEKAGKCNAVYFCVDKLLYYIDMSNLLENT